MRKIGCFYFDIFCGPDLIAENVSVYNVAGILLGYADKSDGKLDFKLVER